MEEERYDLIADALRHGVPSTLNRQERASLARTLKRYRIGPLTRRLELKSNDANGGGLVVVRSADAYELVRYTHINICLHEKFKRTFDRVARSFDLGGNLTKLVRQVIAECPVCDQELESLRRTTELQPIAVSYPFERVGIDFMGPFPISARGNLYVLVIIDHFTKWIIARPTISNDALTVAGILLDMLVDHDPPRYLQSDRGSSFCNDIIRNLSSVTEYCYTTAYHPEANGQTERANREILARMATLIQSHLEDWDIVLPAIVTSLRRSYQSSIRMSPFRSLYGRHPIHPYQGAILATSPVIADEPSEVDIAGHVAKLREIHSLVNGNIEKAQLAQKKAHDAAIRTRVRHKVFNVGDLVQVRRPGDDPLHKLDPGWSTPFKVLGRKDTGAYLIEGYLGPIAAERLRLHVPAASLAIEAAHHRIVTPILAIQGSSLAS